MRENVSAAKAGSIDGNPDAANQFALVYLPAIYLHVLGMVANSTDAQELTQEIFIEVFQRQGDRIRFGRSAKLLPPIASATVQRFVRSVAPGTAQLIKSKDFAALPKDDRSMSGTPGWERLEREMLGNIAVGLAAVRCIEHVGTRRRLRWQAAVAALLLSTLFALGWLTHIPAEQTGRLLHQLSSAFRPHTDATILDSRRGLLTVSANGYRLSMKTEEAGATIITGRAQVSSAYVDEKTGQPMVITVHAK